MITQEVDLALHIFFVKPVGGWADSTQTAKIAASDAAADDEFGRSVSISWDTAVVGAHFDDDAGEKSGSAYVFKFSTLTLIEDLNDNLNVGPGEIVIVDGATINGNVSVDGGTLILSQSSTVTGNIEGINGASVIINDDSIVDGNIEIVISGSGSTLEITDSNVAGNIETNNIAALTIINSILNGNIYSDNDGTVIITDNIDINGNVEIISPASCTESNNSVNGNNSHCP